MIFLITEVGHREEDIIGFVANPVSKAIEMHLTENFKIHGLIKGVEDSDGNFGFQGIIKIDEDFYEIEGPSLPGKEPWRFAAITRKTTKNSNDWIY